MSKHVWIVVMRNEKQGLQKRVTVEAFGFSQAVTFAGDKLVRAGYDRYDFEATEITRGTLVREYAVAS